MELMYQKLADTLREIYEQAPKTANISLEEFIDEVEKRTTDRPSKSTVKRILDQIGISAEAGKKRVWVYRHNGGKE